MIIYGAEKYSGLYNRFVDFNMQENDWNLSSVF
jgi:hypothetical protein